MLIDSPIYLYLKNMRHYFCFLRINYSFFKPLGTSYRVTRNPTQQVNIHENERWKAKLELQRHYILCRLCIAFILNCELLSSSRLFLQSRESEYATKSPTTEWQTDGTRYTGESWGTTFVEPISLDIHAMAHSSDGLP